MLPGSGEYGYCIASDHQIHGSAIIAERGGVAYLWGMYVHPTQQRKGLGLQLLHGVAEKIEAAGKVEARVLVSSTAAISFYKKHGFIETGQEKVELMNSVEAATLVMCASVENLKTAPQ